MSVLSMSAFGGKADIHRGGDQKRTVVLLGAVDEGLDLADRDVASNLPLAIAGLDRGGAELEVARRSLCQRHERRGGKYKKEKDGRDAHGSFSLKTTGEPDATPVAAIGLPAPSLLTC